MDTAKMAAAHKLGDMTSGSVLKKILFFSLPLFLGNIFQQVNFMVDAVAVGQYVGRDGLAAVGIAGQLIFLMISFIIGITIGSSTVISQLFGAKKLDELRTAISTTIIYLFVGTLIITAAGVFLTGPLLRLLQTPPEVYDYAYTFLIIIFGGMIGLFAFNTFGGILRGLGDSKTPNYFLMISCVLNIGLVLLFTGVFKWGVAGSAWATVIAQTVSAVITVVYVFKKIEFLRFRWKDMKFDRKIFAVSIKLGLATGVQQFVVSASFVVLQGLINGFGADTIAACTAGGRLDQIAITFIMSIGMAVQMFAGQNMGAGKLDRVKKGVWVSIAISAVICVLVTGIIQFFGPQIIAAFVDPGSNPNVIIIGDQYIRVLSYFYIIIGVSFIYTSTLRGCGDVVMPLVSTIVAVGGRTVAAYLMASALGPGSIWWSQPVGWGLGLIMVFAWYMTGRWNTKGVVHKIALAEPAIPSRPAPEPEG